MGKSYFDYLGKEDILHHAVYDYLLVAYRGKAMFWHTPNEGRRTNFEAWKAKYLGMMSGVPDWIIVKPGDVLFLELKIKGNKPTENQKIFLENTTVFGFVSEVAYDFDEAKKIIDEFMKGKLVQPNVNYKTTCDSFSNSFNSRGYNVMYIGIFNQLKRRLL